MKTVLRILFCSFIVCLADPVGGQSFPHRTPLRTAGVMEAGAAASTSGTGQNIDVTFHRADWNIDPRAAKMIAGSVTTYFRTRVANVSVITFDFRKSSFGASTSVKYHGTTVPSSFPATGSPNLNILSITLPTPLAINILDSVTITYSGVPPAESGLAYGYQRSSIAPWSIATLSESHEDKDWWPCKADMQDKVDSMRINVTVPWVAPADTFWVASNGVLIDSAITGNTRKFQYLTNYPMASYLVAISVSRYTRFYRPAVNIGGTNVPVVYYLFPRTGSFATTLGHLDKSRTQLVNFSSKFGDYPFKNEKHGFYEYISGGMEHQTFSGMSSTDVNSWSTIAHELVHQWFGDKVTFATWSDVWLAEGFAKYGEILALEMDPSISATTYIAHRNSNKNAARSTINIPVYIPAASATSTDGIFGGYQGAIYNKGGMVVSMLRSLVGDDLFFQALTNYLNDPLLAYKSATTDDLKRHFEQVTGHDFDPFFNSWVYGKGHCDYTVNWGTSPGNRINIELTGQINRTAGATPAYFATPVVLRISGAAKDTTVVIYDENGSVSYAGNGIQASRSGKRLAYKLSFAPSSVTIDPDSETMMAAATVATADPALNNLALVLLGVDIVSFTGAVDGADNLLSIKLSSDVPNVIATMERSENGTDFYRRGEMAPLSSTNGTYSFGYRDGAVNSGKPYYYRVKIKDEKGVISYSKVVRLEQSEEGNGVRISPNPARTQVQVTIPDAWKRGGVQVQVYNSGGVLVTSKAFTAPGNFVTMNLPLLSSGTYTLKMAGADDKAVTKTFSIIQ
ncbi:MAG TPA: M1 family aminopeptidase [Flavisolibacter sp.]